MSLSLQRIQLNLIQKLTILFLGTNKLNKLLNLIALGWVYRG